MPDSDLTNQAPGGKSLPPELHGLDPGELLARGLDTVKPSAGMAAWEPPTPEELGRLLTQYRIESLIGRGGMGAVYKGTQIVLDRPVAIKLLPAEIAADEQFIARFHREARTLARLQHSRIITIHDFGQTSEGHLYFVMEYIDGTDLRKILRGPGLSPEQALLVVGQICDALNAAHAQGVIHRDIKPENILVTKNGYVKLADFGLARPLKQEDVSALTGTHVIMGTADYMAPEQREGQADERADIFALGVMLYEMLTGKPPRGAFEPASRKVRLDARIDEVVLRALQAEPERRYQRVSEMKTDVDRIRNTPLPEPAPVQPPRLAAPVRKRKKSKEPLFAAAIGALLLGIASYFIWSKSGHPSSSPQGGAAATKAPSTRAPEAVAATFVNTLGMKFMPAPGTPALFSCWDTRVKDYAAYARVNQVDGAWALQLKNGVPVNRAPDDPVVGVSWDDANAFCRWLTEKESAEGKLPKGMRYRLATDEEWSRAAGWAKEDGSTPRERSGRNHVPGSRYADYGFRCVLAPAISAPSWVAAPAQTVSSPPPAIAPARTASATPTPPSITAAEQDALKKALLSHPWTCHAMAPESFPWKQVVFWSDGTMTTSATTTARWTITGSHSVALQIGASDRILLIFNSDMNYFTGCHDDGKMIVNGTTRSAEVAAPPAGYDAKPASLRLATPTPPPTLVDSEPTNLRDALLSYTWLWNDTTMKAHFNVNFQENGIIYYYHGKPSRWSMTGPQTIDVVLENGYRTTYTFDKSFKTYTNFHQMSGTRLGKRGDRKVDSGGAPLAAQSTPAPRPFPTRLTGKQTFGSYQEEALLGHTWSWDTVKENGSHVVVQFFQDGRVSRGWHWQWLPKSNGELVVDCFWGPSQHLFLKFDKQFSEFEAYGEAGGCQVRGKRLAP